MRVLGRLLLLGLLAVVVLHWGRPQYLKLRQQALHYLDATPAERAAEPSVTYVYTGTPLEFPLRAGQSTLRVVSTGNVERAVALAAAQQDTVFAFALDYRLLDDDGRELAQRTYHLRTRMTWYRDEASGDLRTAGSYTTSALLPLDSQIFTIDLREFPQARRIRIGVVAPAATLVDVGIRCYQREAVPAYRLEHQWQRMNRKQRERLARGNLFGAEVLRKRERDHLLRNAWQPSAPNGIAGAAYEPRVLYTREDNPDPLPVGTSIAAGFGVDATRVGTVPLPATGARLRLTWEWQGRVPHGAVATIDWYGLRAEAPRRTEVPIDGSISRLEAHFDPGLLELSAPFAAAVRVEHLDGDAIRDFTPTPLVVKTYELAADTGLTYTITHAGGQVSPFRFDLRARLGHAAEAVTIDGSLDLLDAGGRLLGSHPLHGTRPPSRYDRLADPAEWLVSEPLSGYLLLGRDVAAVRLRPAAGAARPLLANAYTRPADLVRVTRIPEDALPGRDPTARLPTWFGLQPPAAGRPAGPRLRLVETQPRPAVERLARATEIASGEYEWVDFRPETTPPGRELLTLREPDAVPRALQAPVSYRALTPQATHLLEFTANGQDTVSPSLLWIRPRATPLSLTLTLDGQPLMVPVAGTRGSQALPALSPGRHAITLSTAEAGDFFVNDVVPAATDRLRRFAYRFDRAALTYTFTRTTRAPETLSARLFTPGEQPHRVKLRVTIAGPAVATNELAADWSPRDRRYDILPDHAARVPVLGTAGETVDRGRAFFIPFGASDPPGQYRVTITREDGPAGYLVLAKLTPGRFEQRAIQRETESRHVEVAE